MPLRKRQFRVGVVLLAVFPCDLLDLAKKSDLCFGRHATRGVVVLATYREESQMKRKTVLAAITAIAAGVSLSGCYVVPIDPRYPAAEQPGLNTVPRPLAVPASQPVPTTLQARLYPLNETAGKMGALTAMVSDNVNGHATFSLSHAGELLQGEASGVPAEYPGFGKVHREVYGEGRMPAGQRGIASAAGPRGTYVNCEYALNAPNRKLLRV